MEMPVAPSAKELVAHLVTTRLSRKLPRGELVAERARARSMHDVRVMVLKALFTVQSVLCLPSNGRPRPAFGGGTVAKGTAAEAGGDLTAEAATVQLL